MLKVRTGLMIIALCVSAVSGMAEVKGAAVDGSAFLQVYPAAVDADKERAAAAESFAAEAKGMREQLKKVQEQFVTARDASRNKTLNEGARKAKEIEAEKFLMDYKKLEVTLPKTLAKRKSELSELRAKRTQDVMEEVSALIAEFAKKEGYDLVLEASGVTPRGLGAVLYAGESIDITPKLIAKFKVN